MALNNERSMYDMPKNGEAPLALHPVLQEAIALGQQSPLRNSSGRVSVGPDRTAAGAWRIAPVNWDPGSPAHAPTRVHPSGPNLPSRQHRICRLASQAVCGRMKM